MALGIVGWTTGGFERTVSDFFQLVDGPLPSVTHLFRWAMDWGTLAACASIYLLIVAAFFRTCQVRYEDLPMTSLAAMGVDSGLAIALIVVSWIFGPMASHRSEWIIFIGLPVAIPCGLLALFSTGMWWLAPTFQALRDGSLPALPRFPARAIIRSVTALAAHLAFRSYWIGSYGIFALLILDAGMIAVRYGLTVRFGMGPIVDRH